MFAPAATFNKQLAGSACLFVSLPEFLDFVFFWKTILVVNNKTFFPVHSGSELFVCVCGLCVRLEPVQITGVLSRGWQNRKGKVLTHTRSSKFNLSGFWGILGRQLETGTGASIPQRQIASCAPADIVCAQSNLCVCLPCLSSGRHQHIIYIYIYSEMFYKYYYLHIYIYIVM